MKRVLVVKEAKARIKVFDSHLEVSTFYENQYIGFAQIASVYINKNTNLYIGEAIRIARHVPFYFIDARGNILGKVCIKR